MTNRQHKQLLRNLRGVSAKHSLRTLTGFWALGQYVRDRLGTERAQYGAAELAALGKELRREIPDWGLPENAVPLLQAARRVARAFTADDIAEYEQPTQKGYRLCVQHLRVVAMANNAKKLLRQCRQQRWSVRELQAALAQSRPPRSQGGRRLSSAASGVRTLLKTAASLRRWAEQHAGEHLAAVTRQLQRIERGVVALATVVEPIDAPASRQKRTTRRR